MAEDLVKKTEHLPIVSPVNNVEGLSYAPLPVYEIGEITFTKNMMMSNNPAIKEKLPRTFLRYVIGRNQEGEIVAKEAGDNNNKHSIISLIPLEFLENYRTIVAYEE